MKKIKRILGFVVCIILAFYYIVPFFVGIFAEKEFDSMVKNLENQLGTKIETKYNRGWFSSKAKLLFCVQNVAKKINPIFAESFSDTYFRSDYKISHGFFPFTGNFKDRKALEPVIAVLQGNSFFSNSFFNKELQIESSAVINIDGELTGTLIFQKNRLYADDLDELYIKIEEAEMIFSVSKDLDKGKLTATFPNINISDNKNLFNTKNIKISYNFLKDKNKFPIGKTEVKIEKCVVKSRESSSKKFELTNFRSSKSLDEKNNLVFGKMKIGFDKLNFHQKKFGPADFEFVFKNFDSKTLAEIQKAENEIQLENSQMASVMFISKLTTLLPKLIKKSPEIELTKCKAVTPDGDFSGYLKAKIYGKDFVDFTKIKDDINKLYLEANFTVPGKLAEEFSLTNNFIKFVKDGKNYKTDILFENGILEVNGKEMKLPLLNFL